MSKRLRYGMIFCLLLGLVFLISGSFAWLQFQIEGTKRTTMEAGNMTIIFDGNFTDGIIETNFVPMYEKVALRQDGYQFTIENRGTVHATYQVTLEDIPLTDETLRVEDRLIRYSVSDSLGMRKSGLLSDTENRVLMEGKLEKGKNALITLHLWGDENATASIEKKSFSAKVGVTVTQEIDTVQLADQTDANAPVLDQNMIPVRYDEGQREWVKADIRNLAVDPWYNYEDQMWANAVTVWEENLKTYQNASVGAVIPMEKIRTMWVWIPKYEYLTTSLASYAGGTASVPGQITLRFIQGTGTGSGTVGYVMPEAFANRDTVYDGLWVGKFVNGIQQAGVEENWNTTEAGLNLIRNEKLLIKPNIPAWRVINAYRIYAVSRNTALTPSYGFQSNKSSTYGMRNSDWGAVAYLSQSKYGKRGNPMYSGENFEVYNNPSLKALAGYSSGAPTSQKMTEGYSYDDLLDRGGGLGAAGAGASTTGNIYGVYDMNGMYTLVLSNFMNGGTTLNVANSGFAEPYPNMSYFNLYESASTASACNGGICYGHALSETAGWYGDANYIPTAERPWFYRGYTVSDTNTTGGDRRTGIFSYSNSTGQGYTNVFYRTVLAVKN